MQPNRAKYKVIKDYVNKNGTVCRIGDIIDVALPLGKFTAGLAESGFIEKLPSIDLSNWKRRGIKSKLANILIAPEDYAEGDKQHFTWDEAMEIEKKLPDGWRLPTRHEIVLIAEEFGRDLKTDKLDSEWLEKNLGFMKNGWKSADGELFGRDSSGCYWSRTASSSTRAYHLDFSSSDFGPASYDSRYYGFSVRCVKDLGAQDGR